MEQHIAKVQNVAANLIDLGEVLSDAAISAKLLSSVTSKYSTLQTAWESVDPTRQTLENLQARLIREEARLKSDGDEGASALAASRQVRDKKKKKRSKKKVECYKCHELGHFARECKKDKNHKSDSNGKDECDCAFIGIKPSAMASPAASCESVTKLKQAKQKEIWLTDSGASAHMTFRREWFAEYQPSSQGGTVVLGDNEECPVLGSGTINIKKFVNGVWVQSTINNVLYVPGLKKNLFSVGVCAENGFTTIFEESQVKVMREDKLVASGIRQNNRIYRMLFVVVPPGEKIEANVSVANFRMWHERLGHVGKRAIRDLVNKGLVKGVKMTDTADFFCKACQLGKAHRLPFKKRDKKVTTKPGEKIHTDVCGPMSVESLGGARYFLTFKDDATGFRHVYFIKHKSDVYEKYLEYEHLVKNKFGQEIKVLRSDNGREFCNKEMDKYLLAHGIEKENTAPHTPEQNGRAERDNRTIVESARSMMQSKGLPTHLWAEAVNTAVYVINRTVTADNEATSYELWHGKKPNIEHLRIFGSKAFVHVPKQFTKKFDARAKEVVFVGYQGDSENYRVFDPTTRRVSVSRNVTFDEETERDKRVVRRTKEGVVLCLPRDAPDEEDVIEILDDDEDEEEVYTDPEEPEPPAVRARNPTPPRPAPEDEGRVLRNRAEIRPPIRYEVDVAEYVAPSSYSEAMNSNDAAQWARAIQEELQAHERNRTWSLVSRTPGQQVIDSRWVFRVKQDSETQSKKFKARLCARGFKQRPGIDFSETFAPVVRYDSLRTVLATVAERDLELMQFDVQTAFLYGQLKEEIYMEIPEGFSSEKNAVNSETSDVVCKLEKSLYGLKQAPRCWNEKFHEFLNEYEFEASEADQCVLIGKVENERVYLAIFVDDGLVAARSKHTLETILNKLNTAFNITIGDASLFVGLQIKRDRDSKSLSIHQAAYTKKIIERFNMSDSKAIGVPADPHMILLPVEQGSETINVPYREAVGSLMFLAVVSRPDIAFAVNSVSKFTNNHNQSHWQAIKRILAYLNGTIDYGIMYQSGGSKSNLRGYSDADFAGDVETRRSTTGFVFFLSNGPITWSSARQKLITLSTTESEYVAASAATKEAIWLRKLIKSLEFSCEEPTVLFVDNLNAIRLVKNAEFHKRTKHIDIRYHYIREKAKNNEIRVEHIASEIQRADIFTKALPKERFKMLRESLNMYRV